MSNISHDLRTLLTSIIGYIQLIQDEYISYEEKNIY
ncbi:histidine kinase dimerization/phospho-acceptor domain-containing protein [Paraclostridium sordellii]